jgi:hypothetical protein
MERAGRQDEGQSGLVKERMVSDSRDQIIAALYGALSMIERKAHTALAMRDDPGARQYGETQTYWLEMLRHAIAIRDAELAAGAALWMFLHNAELMEGFIELGKKAATWQNDAVKAHAIKAATRKSHWPEVMAKVLAEYPDAKDEQVIAAIKEEDQRRKLTPKGRSTMAEWVSNHRPKKESRS